MSTFWNVLIVILLVLVIALALLYYFGQKAQKKQAAQQEQLEATRQVVSMLIIDKKNDVVTLRNLGANDKQITRVFLFEGRMIAVIGAVIGIGLGLLLCFLQQQYGFVRLGDSEGSFIVDAYPVSVHYSDVAIIFVTVIAVGWLAVWYPVRALSKSLLS